MQIQVSPETTIRLQQTSPNELTIVINDPLEAIRSAYANDPGPRRTRKAAQVEDPSCF